MNWTYYTWNSTDGHLYDDSGDVDICGKDGKPIAFASAAEAEQYLEDNDIRANVR